MTSHPINGSSNDKPGADGLQTVDLGITVNGQPWNGGLYEAQVNANMRDFQNGTIRPFEGIEDPPAYRGGVKGWAHRHRLRLVAVGAVLFAMVLGGVWLTLMLQHRSLAGDSGSATITRTVVSNTIASHSAQDVDVNVIVTQAPAPVPALTTLLTATTTIPGSPVSIRNALWGTGTTYPHQPPLTSGQTAIWTQSVMNVHCGFDVYTWAISADAATTTSSMVGPVPHDTFYSWCKTDGENSALFASYWHTTPSPIDIATTESFTAAAPTKVLARPTGGVVVSDDAPEKVLPAKAPGT